MIERRSEALSADQVKLTPIQIFKTVIPRDHLVPGGINRIIAPNISLCRKKAADPDTGSKEFCGFMRPVCDVGLYAFRNA